MALKDIRENRLGKRLRLKNADINAYPLYLKRTHTIGDVRTTFKKLSDSEKEIIIVGRIMSFREHGGSSFCDVRDGMGVVT